MKTEEWTTAATSNPCRSCWKRQISRKDFNLDLNKRMERKERWKTESELFCVTSSHNKGSVLKFAFIRPRSELNVNSFTYRAETPCFRVKKSVSTVLSLDQFKWLKIKHGVSHYRLGCATHSPSMECHGGNVNAYLAYTISCGGAFEALHAPSTLLNLKWLVIRKLLQHEISWGEPYSNND